MESEKFSEYLFRVMRQKGLNARDVERNSDKRIDSSHVSKFLRGVETNPSANAMKALAAGLGVNPHEVFTAVTGCSPDDSRASSPDVMELISMMERVAMDPDLMDGLRSLARLPIGERDPILELVKYSGVVNQEEPRKARKKKGP
jgi:transcriptional regulator with XRE-family HTH domain